MTSYTDVFGSETVPPSEQGYRAVTLTADVALGFPSVTDGTNIVAGIMDVTASVGPFSITLPAANTGSVGEETLMRNLSANDFLVKDFGGNTLATVSAGQSKYFYLADNSTTTGTWRVITYGTGTSGADASALAGNGLKVVGSALALNKLTNTTSSNQDLDTVTDRGEVWVFTGGSVTCNLPSAATAGNGWFVSLSNQGTGTVTVDNTDGALINGATNFLLAPTESADFYTDGVAWYTVGYGRSASFVFTKLVKDISTGSPFTLTSAECSNKLLQFIGTATADVTVNVPPVVAIYYVQCAFTGTYTLTLKTAAGSGIALDNVARSILYCDGTNVVDAQTVAASTILAMVDGSASFPSLYFSSDTDTGIYRAGTNSFGIAAGGAQSAVFTTSGINSTPIGATSPSTGAFTTLSAVTPLAATSGGTSYSSYAVGDIIYANTTTTLAKLAGVATGNALISGGVSTAPSWGKIGLTTHVSGILPTANGGTNSAYFTVSGPTVARTFTFPDANATVLTSNTPVTAVQGGTGQSSYTVGDLLYASTTTALSKLSPNTSGNVLTSNGPGVAPTFQALPGGFPSGTRMSFNQTSAPTGWTKDTTAALDDSIMRIVTGTVSSGGSNGFSTFNAQTTVGATTLTISQMPAHAHSYTTVGTSTATGSKGGLAANTQAATTGSQGGGTSHNHTITTSIKYNDFIIASKD